MSNIKKRIYLDYAAATPLHPEVKEAMDKAGEHWANPSSLHEEGRLARAIVDQSREVAAKFLNAKDSEIIFTSGATESNVLAIRGAVQFAKHQGMENISIAVSKIEHPSIRDCAKQLIKEGVNVKWIGTDRQGRISKHQLTEAVNENTILVSIGLANHEIGIVQDIAQLVKIIKGKNSNTLVHTDAAAAAGWLNLDVNNLGIDFLTLSGYKIYGPKGIGALYVREGVKLLPIFPGFQEWGKRAGTESTTLIAGFSKAIELISDWNKSEVEELRNQLIADVLKNIDEVVVNTEIHEALPHIAHFSFAGTDGQLLTIALDKEGVAASPGSACSSGAVQVSHIVEELGIDLVKYPAQLRLSLGLDTSTEELAQALDILKRVIKGLRERSVK